MKNHSTLSLYIKELAGNKNQLQAEIERLILKYQVQVVGNGYIDMIVLRSNALALISDLTQINICVNVLSWWCLCTPESQATLGCPHGMGGPTNKFGVGWFSELGGPYFDLKDLGIDFEALSISQSEFVEGCNRIVSDYLENDFEQERFFTGCLHPGLWLLVPDEWRRSNN